MKNDIIYYSVGALLYCPANKKTIADSVIHEKFGTKYSLALCLEDTINDNYVTEAEQDLISSIHQIFESFQDHPFYLPKIFIRVRNAGQIERLTKAFGESIKVITGYIIPKFTADNASSYIEEMIRANEQVSRKLYMMPIYESSSIIDLRHRIDILYDLKDRLSHVEDLVLNIRVGGNDLCHMFGFRRHCDESIHRIRTVYGMDYVVSGPVWEYYSGYNWENGLIQELKDDKLCGFTGKTVIHPNQISVVNKVYQVTRSDFNDAKAILNWDKKSDSLVSGNLAGERMNEYKTHHNWAEKILFLAEVFGITD